MLIAHRSPGRHFTDAARTAARDARRRKSMQMLDLSRPEVFVVRGQEDARRFGWQIRRFGGVVLNASRSHYTSIADAQTAGDAALRALLADAP